MNKAILFVTIVFLTITSACGKNNPVNIVTPTETASPLISFAIPQDGETIEYEAMYFQVDPVPSAEGFAWTFTQNGRVFVGYVQGRTKTYGHSVRNPKCGQPE